MSALHTARQRLRLPRWSRAYALLAALNLCTVILALGVSHRLRQDLADSVAVNRLWSERLAQEAEVAAAARAIDAPANEIFGGANPPDALERLHAAVQVFDERVSALRDQLTRDNATPAEREALLADVDHVISETSEVASAGDHSIKLMTTGRADEAARWSAAMDLHFHLVDAALTDIFARVNRIQQDYLSQQQAAADSVTSVEYAIVTLVVIMLGASVLYGARIAQETDGAARERERLSRAQAAREQAEESAQEIAALLDASKRIRSSLDPETTLDSILDTVISMFRCEVAGLALVEHDDPTMLRYAASRGPHGDVLRGVRFPMGAGLMGAAAETGETIVRARLREDPRWQPFFENDLKSGVFVRLGTGDSLIGALAAMSMQQDHFGETEGRLLTGIAEHASLAVEHSREVAARLAAEAALHASDERYRLAFEATQDVILDADIRTGQVVWSPRTSAVFGFEPAEMGATLTEWVLSKIHPDDVPHVRTIFTRSLKQGGAFRIECRHLHANGTYRDVLSHGWIVHDENRRAIRTVGALTDVTQQNQAAHELREARDAALEATRAKSAFLATMSHEIRTPLNGVIGMTGLLLDSTLSPRQREFAEAVRRSGETLLALINDILDFSKIEYSRLELEIIELDVREAVEDAVALLADQAQRKGLEIAARVPPEIPRFLKGDPARLRQVLTNLVGNAVKFTERGEVVVRVSVVERDVPHGTIGLRFEIADTGIGIPESARERLFEPFSQADSSTTRRYGGTGLGLAISRRLVSLMDGEIGLDSVDGKGSTFWFTIRAGVASEATAPGGVPPRELRGLRVLAVDDNATNRQILEEQLASWNMRVWTAEDGPSALALIAELRRADSPPDLMLLDMHMPGMDGLQLAHAIRNQAWLTETRMVLLTSLGQGELESAALLAAGVCRALTKPVRQSMLFDAIAGAMDGGDVAVATSPVQTPILDRAARPLVLVAEDTAVNQEVARAMLEKLGYRADVVANGREAIDMVQRIPYLAVLMDVQMPEMDGIEATQIIRRRNPPDARRIPIIALTANAMGGDRERCLEAGMDDYLAKPIRMTELAAVLGRWVPLADAQPRSTQEHAVAPSATAVDASVLAELSAMAPPGKPSPVPRLVNLFLVDSERRISGIREAAARGDVAEVQRLAHAQKGSSSTLGARELGVVAAELDEQAKSGSLVAAPELLERLDSAYERTCRALEPYRKAEGPSAAA